MVTTERSHHRNIKALALTVQKLLARLKFQRGGQNDRQDKNNMPPDLRPQEHKKITSKTRGMLQQRNTNLVLKLM